MFRFTRKPSSGSHSQYLAKITNLVLCEYIELVQDVVSVMAAHYYLWGVCAVHSTAHTHTWWWFPRKPKNVGSTSLIWKCFNNYVF